MEGILRRPNIFTEKKGYEKSNGIKPEYINEQVCVFLF